MLHLLDLPNNQLIFPGDDWELFSRVCQKFLLVSVRLGDPDFECRIEDEAVDDRKS